MKPPRSDWLIFQEENPTKHATKQVERGKILKPMGAVQPSPLVKWINGHFPRGKGPWLAHMLSQNSALIKDNLPCDFLFTLIWLFYVFMVGANAAAEKSMGIKDGSAFC